MRRGVDVVRADRHVSPSAGTIWGTKGGDLVLVGQTGPQRIDVDSVQHRMAASESIAASLREVGFATAVDLLATYSGRASDVAAWLAGAEINRDRSLRLQYRAGLHVNFDSPEAIYASIIGGRRYPDDLFVASEKLKEALKQAIGASEPENAAPR